jgi:hypothetical protein
MSEGGTRTIPGHVAKRSAPGMSEGDKIWGVARPTRLA